jgi:hypothetical protein
LMPLSSVSVVVFAIGATRWMARRTFGHSSIRRIKGLSPVDEAGRPALAGLEEAVS